MNGYEYKHESHAVYVRKEGETEWKLIMYFPPKGPPPQVVGASTFTTGSVI